MINKGLKKNINNALQNVELNLRKEHANCDPIQFFHIELMDQFHKMRKNKVGENTFIVEIDGKDLTLLIAATKKKIYKFYPGLRDTKSFSND